MKIKFNTKGTTLVEILTYFAILGVVMLAIMNFAIQIIDSNRVNSNYQELNSNLEFTTRTLTTKIKEADVINVVDSIFNNDIGRLSLNMNDPFLTPTVFYISGGNVFIQEGAGSPVQLNNSLVEFTKLRFERVTNPKAPDLIIFDAEARIINIDLSPSEKNITVHTSATLRR